MIRREVAWRVFAGEFNASTLHVKDSEEERSPSYVVTPIGAMINRMFVVGVLTENENIGTDNEPMWRGRISDPTGTFYISAGKYQPEAASMLSRLKVPAFVAVIGKSRVYSPEGGKMYLSIRPETIVEVDAGIRDLWILDTAKATLLRMEAMKAATTIEEPSENALVEQGYSPTVAHGVMRSYQFYGMTDLDKYRSMVLATLKRTLPNTDEEDHYVPNLSAAEEIDIEERPDDMDQEDSVLDVIEELDLDGRGAPLDDLISATSRMEMDRTRLEEVINSLLDKGLIYEPVLGKMKRI